jgi:hypothetical protein
MKNANLLCYPHSSLLRRTFMYASLLGISGALHFDVFDQPARQVFSGGYFRFFLDVKGVRWRKGF